MRFYKKKQVQPMEPWHPGLDMAGVSISEADLLNGSPKKGDMIAVNPKNPTDKWLVAKKFFEDNYEEVESPYAISKTPHVDEVVVKGRD